MCPAVLDTDSPVQYPTPAAPPSMEDKFFPPISRKSTMSITTSEPDPIEYKHERSATTRGSMPGSLSSSPVKFPTIDRSNSTSVASLSGSRAARHRSKSRDLRSSYCRSPSCPTQLDMGRDFNTIDFAIFNRQVHSEDINPSEEITKLPNIFSKDLGTHMDISKNVLHRNKPHDATNALSLRRSESFKNALNGMNEPLSCRESEQPLSPRQNQTAALLLPIRTESKLNSSRKKSKKSRRGRVRDAHDNDSSELSKKAIEALNDDALDAITHENRQSEDEDTNTSRAIDMKSSRKVKQWMSENRTSQKGQIKA